MSLKVSQLFRGESKLNNSASYMNNFGEYNAEELRHCLGERTNSSPLGGGHV